MAKSALNRDGSMLNSFEQMKIDSSGFSSSRLARNPSYVTGIANSQVPSPISRASSIPRPSSSGQSSSTSGSLRMVTVNVVMEPRRDSNTSSPLEEHQEFRLLSSQQLARNFEIFESSPLPEEVTIPYSQNGFIIAKQLIDDKPAMSNFSEIFNHLAIAKKWRMKRKAKSRLLDTIKQTLMNNYNLSSNDIRQFDELCTPDEFSTIFEAQIKRTEQQIGQMEKELRGVDNITYAFLSKWLKLLANPLIQPRCEKLFELTKNVFCVVFEKNVSWYDTDFMKLFFSINIIQDCDELQSLIYTSLEKFLETDEKVAQDTNWGLMGDELVSQLRRIVITKNWNYGIPRNHSFLRRFLESGMTTPIHYTSNPDDLESSTSVDLLTCALNAHNWLAAKYLIHTQLSQSLTLEDYKELDNTNKNKDYQIKGYHATKKSKDPWKIHVEYFIEEINTKVALDFFLKEFSALLREHDIFTPQQPDLTANDVESDQLALLQKAVAQNKIELIEKYIKVFKMDINKMSAEYPLPPIFVALSKRKVRSTELLIRSGADLMATINIENVELNIFDVICANKNSFARTEEKNRRMMAKRFQQKVIEDARKAGSPFPSGHSQPHYHNPYSTWPKLPNLKFRTNDSSLLRNFQKS